MTWISTPYVFFDPEPFPRNSRDRLTVLFNLILMINEVAAPMHIGAALNFDLEPVSNTDERFCITPVSP